MHSACLHQASEEISILQTVLESYFSLGLCVSHSAV